MFLYQVPFKQYTVTNNNGIVETDIVRAINSSYDTAYVLCSRVYYNTYESVLYDNAYENLINDKVDIVFANAHSNEEIEKAKSNDAEFILTPIGKEAFVFFVNSKNKIDNLSKENIKNIQNGTYSLSAAFYAVTTKKAMNNNPNIKKLIDFILSKDGQYLVEKSSYTPIK